MESDETDNSSNPELDAVGQLARAYRLWAAIIGAFVLLVLLVNSQGANSKTEIVTSLATAIVGFVPMVGVAYGLRHGFPWGRYAAYALPLCQAVGVASLYLSDGPASELSGLGLFVRDIIAVNLYQCPVTAVLALMVLGRSHR